MDESPTRQDRANFVKFLHETEIECNALYDASIRESLDKKRSLKIKKALRWFSSIVFLIVWIGINVVLGYYFRSYIFVDSPKPFIFLFISIVAAAILWGSIYDSFNLSSKDIDLLKTISSKYYVVADMCRKDRHMLASSAKYSEILNESAEAIRKYKSEIDLDYSPDPDELIRSRRAIRKEMEDTDYDPIKTIRVEEVKGIPGEFEDFDEKLSEVVNKK